VVQVATHAWKLLPQYRLNPRTGQYTHCGFDKAANLRSIAEINIGPGAPRCELITHAILRHPMQWCNQCGHTRLPQGCGVAYA
jgi:ribosomal protein L37E